MDAHALWALLRTSFEQWNTDKAPRLGAALAYYAVFALAPLLIIATAMAARIYGPDAVRGTLEAQIQGLLGADAARVIQEIVARANRPGSGLTAGILGLATL